MHSNLLLSLALLSMVSAAAFAESPSPSDVKIIPVSHASFVMQADGKTIWVDPVGMDRFTNQPKPDYILITHTHPDHLDLQVIKTLGKDKTLVILPPSVQEKFPNGTVLTNGQSTNLPGLFIEAVPMYNMTAVRTMFHPKGQGNGYLLTIAGKRVYISGDTEDTPEMRSLKGIDIAFICMNLPYTMTVEQAASGVLAFAPKQVYPYHTREMAGFSDVKKFQELVHQGNPKIEVILADWYPKK